MSGTRTSGRTLVNGLEMMKPARETAPVPPYPLYCKILRLDKHLLTVGMNIERKHAPTALLRYTEKDGRNGGVVRLKAQGGGGKGVRLAKGESDQRTTNSDDARGACCG